MSYNSEELRDYAMTLDDATQRAARDGYDVRPLIIAAIVEQLGTPWRIIRASDPGGFGILQLEQRTAPTTAALDTRALLLGRSRRIKMPPAATAVVADVSRATIKRFRPNESLNPGDPRPAGGVLTMIKRTVVPVVIKTDWSGDTIVLFDAEGAHV